MKTAALILALFLFFKPILPLLEYAAFYDYIKNELCENQDVPEMQCNGKCHLKKELVKASNSENDTKKSHSYSAEHSTVYFHEKTPCYSCLISDEQNSKINIAYNNSYKFHYMEFVFHPPLV